MNRNINQLQSTSQSQILIYNAIKGRTIDTSQYSTIDIYMSGGINISNISNNVPDKEWVVLTIWDDIGLTSGCTQSSPCAFLKIMTYIDSTTETNRISMIQINNFSGTCKTSIQDISCINVEYSDSSGKPISNDIPSQVAANATGSLTTSTTATCVKGQAYLPGIGCTSSTYVIMGAAAVTFLLLTRR